MQTVSAILHPQVPPFRAPYTPHPSRTMHPLWLGGSFSAPSRALLLVLALLPLAGCAALQKQTRALGSSAVEGATGYLDSEAGRQRIRATSDSSLASLSAAYQRQLLPALDSTFVHLRTGTHSFLHVTQDSLVRAIRGPISASFQSLLRENLRTAGEEGRAQLALTVAGLDQELQARFVPILVGAVGASVDTALARTAAGESRLRPMMDSIVSSAVRAGVQAGVRTAREEGQPLWRKLAWGGAAVLATLVGLAGWWLWQERKRRGEALAAIAAAINDHVQQGDGQIKKRIKVQAQARQVEGYLLSFLEKEGFRNPAPAGEPRPPAGKIPPVTIFPE